jgi:4'-phosphopantetheinyl transferase EntD
VTKFQLCYRSAVPHGILCGVNLDDSDINWSNAALECLHQDEISYAKSLKGYKQRTWLAGRVATKHALINYTDVNSAILSDPFGSPIPPDGYVLSITHKDDIAIGLVAVDRGQHVGVDFEHFEPMRTGIISRVLRDEELEMINEMPESRQWISGLISFSAKEAIYKAIAPHLKRYVGFKELALSIKVDGIIDVTWHLEKGPTPTAIDVRYIWHKKGVLTSAEVYW